MYLQEEPVNFEDMVSKFGLAEELWCLTGQVILVFGHGLTGLKNYESSFKFAKY